MEKLNMKSRISFRKNYLKPALENRLIKMINPENVLQSVGRTQMCFVFSIFPIQSNFKNM